MGNTLASLNCTQDMKHRGRNGAMPMDGSAQRAYLFRYEHDGELDKTRDGYACHRRRPLPSLVTIFIMFFTMFLSCATYSFSLPVLTPPAVAVLAPETAAATSSLMEGISLMMVAFVPFVNAFIDRQ